ncbi:MAG TPA: S8 family peptidase, partial [Armatimonadota bacterium]|nr:S8 family peptidase [Armatimonadota bacterium]
TTPPPTGTTYTGSLSGTGANSYQPSTSGYSSSVSGTHTGKLTGTGTDFDLYLQKWNGSSWATVASSLGSTSTENVSYNGTAGTYRWRVYSYSGSGTFSLTTTRP